MLELRNVDTYYGNIQALRVAHRGYVMENGRVVMEDTAANLLQSDEVRSAYLGV